VKRFLSKWKAGVLALIVLGVCARAVKVFAVGTNDPYKHYSTLPDGHIY